MEIPEVVNDYVDAFAHVDVDGCASAFAPDGIYADPGTGGSLSGLPPVASCESSPARQ